MASTTGRTGYPSITYSDPMSGPEQIDAVAAHFDALVGESVATAADLPSSGNWTGRHIYVSADPNTALNGDYVWSGSTWVQVASQSVIGIVAAGGSLGTGWTADPAPNVPRIVREGNKRTLYGSVAFGTGSAWSSLLIIPAADLPPTSGSRRIGTCMSYNGTTSLVIEMRLSGGVVGQVAGTGSLTGANTHCYLDGLSWYMD